MSAKKELRWLKTATLKGAARRFAEFYQQDVEIQAEKDPDFDGALHDTAAKLILEKLESSQQRRLED